MLWPTDAQARIPVGEVSLSLQSRGRSFALEPVRSNTYIEMAVLGRARVPCWRRWGNKRTGATRSAAEQIPKY